MRRAWILAAALIAAPAAADEEPGAPASAADQVLAAIAAKDETALQRLARRGLPDPWHVADELCRRNEHDAAVSFAKAAPRPDLQALPAYVEDRRRKDGGAELRDALARTTESATLDPEKALEILEPLDASGDDVPSIRVTTRTGVVLAELNRHQPALKAFLDAAERAERLGWLAAASRNLRHAAVREALVHGIPAAIAMRERLLSLEQRRACVADEAVALVNLAVQYQQLRRTEEAARSTERARALLEGVGPAERELAGMTQEAFDEAHAVLTLQLGLVDWARGDDAGGDGLLRSAASELERLGLDLQAGQTRGTLGERLVQRGQNDEAVEELTRARETFERGKSAQGVAWTSGNLGWAYSNLGRYDLALAEFQRAYDISKRLGSVFYMGTSLLSIGQVHEHKGEYEKALSAAQKARELFQRINQRGQEAQALLNLGTAHWRLAQWNEAIDRLEEARQIHEALENPTGVAAALTNLGLVFQSLSDFTKASEYQRRALALQETAKNDDGIARALNNLALTYDDEGRYAAAMRSVERALEIARKIGNRTLEATTLGNLAAVCASVGAFRRALVLHEEALALKVKIGDRAGTAVTRMNVGRMLDQLGRRDEARDALLQARTGFREVGDRQGEAGVLVRLGGLEGRHDHFAAARGHFSEAEKIFEEVGSTAGIGWSQYNVGDAYVFEGKAKEALAAFQRSSEIGERIGSESLVAMSLAGIARARSGAGEHEKAITAARDALARLPAIVGGLADDQGSAARARFADVYVLGATSAAHLDDAASFVEFVEAGRAGALLEWLKGGSSLRDWVVPEELRSLEEEARREEAAARVRYHRAVKEGRLMAMRVRQEELNAARHEVAEVVRKVRGRARASANVIYPSPDSLETLQGRIKKGEAFLLYALLTDEVAALVVTPEVARIVRLGAIDEVLADSVLVADPAPGVDRSAETARLRKRLIEPLALGEDVRRLLVSPDGFLSRVPLGVLDRDREIVYLPSGTTYGVLAQERAFPGDQVLALGDPDYGTRQGGGNVAASRSGPDLLPLPKSRAEVKALGDEILVGPEASETRFRSAVARGSGWRSVHLACHGIVDAERPMLSSLALSADDENDGRLTILDVFRMRIPSQLVVLSACRTAEGQDYRAAGVVGFARAFMFAGSPRVVVSLWKVDDEATMALMAKFYELWNPKDGAKGLPPATALKQAQDHVAAQERWKHPYYWAAWQLWGLPD